ncbi:Uncharacterized protein APZ42_006063, partial [Daphnia magna]
ICYAGPRKQSPSFRLIAVCLRRFCLRLRHRFIASSLSLPASSSSSRLSSLSSHRRLRLIAVDSSPSSPLPSPSFYYCLRFRHHLIAVFNFAIGSSPSSSLPISSPWVYNDGAIGSRKTLMAIERP